MFKKLLYLVLPLVGFALAACSDVTAPTPAPVVGHVWTAPDGSSHDVIAPNPDGTCRSGYSVATGRNGEIVCVSDEGSEQSLRVRHVKVGAGYNQATGRMVASGYVNLTGRLRHET